MDSKTTLIQAAKDFSVRMSKKNIDSFASSTAFFLILSLIPLLALLTSLLPYTPLTEGDLMRILDGITPDFANDTIEKLIGEVYENSFAAISISAIVTLWSGSLGMLSLIKGLNIIYEVKELRNYFYLRFIASLYTLAMSIILLMMLVLTVFGSFLQNFIIRAYPPLEYIVSFLMHFRFIFVIGVAFVLFVLMYTYIPSVKLKLVYQVPGAIFSAVVWYAFSWIFSFYVKRTNHYSIYGSLATPVILMFWLYICVYIFLIGAFLNICFNPGVVVLYNDHHKKVRKRKSAK